MVSDDKFVRLSESVIWSAQREFFQKQSVKAWSENVVPSFVSTNSFIAARYARLILAIMRDMQSGGKLRVLEVGAGHGKLGFLIVKELIRLKPCWPDSICFKYVVTDFSKANVAFMQSHSSFQEYFELGIMDCVEFDAESVVVNDDDDGSSPILFICNYVFDSLRQDSFRFENGKWKQSLCKAKLILQNSSNSIQDVHFEWAHENMDHSSSYYGHGESGLDELLALHMNQFEHILKEDGSLLLPVGGIRMMESVRHRWCKNRTTIWLVGDKGHIHPEEWIGPRDPHLANHGSVSFMVNFNSLRLFSEQVCKGLCFETPYENGFKCGCYVLPPINGKETKGTMAELALEWYDSCNDFDAESFNVLQRTIYDRCKSPSLEFALSLVRLSNHDPDIFYKFRKSIMEQTPFVSERKQMADIIQDVELIRGNHFQFGDKTRDVYFELGRVCMGLKRYDQAIHLFQDSRNEHGDHFVNFFNKGICEFKLQRYEAALQSFDTCLQLTSDQYEDAHAWKAKTKLMMSSNNNM